jgi:hypothetical protein
MRESHNTISATIPDTEGNYNWLDIVSPLPNANQLQPGEIYHMDFGFPWGLNYHTKAKFGTSNHQHQWTKSVPTNH